MSKSTIAAVPEYLQKCALCTASPALRFGMYLPIWRRESWNKVENTARSALPKVAELTEYDRKIAQALRKRQAALGKQAVNRHSGDLHMRVLATSVSPFTTGLGNEHPLENGFAFLNPYGLPYLPGSGIKGALRRAAEELAHREFTDTDNGWTPPDVQRLFGFEPLKSREPHTRGALSFRDVVPQITAEDLSVEIMTPHQSHYFQGKEHPHDSGDPIPIHFLAVPPGSRFDFDVVADARLLGCLSGRWKELLEQAFEQAFKWLGFGAKTSVGYGAMQRDTKREEREAREEEERRRQKEEQKRREEELAKMSPVQRAIREYLDTRRNKQVDEITDIITEVKKGRWKGEEKLEVAQWLKDRMQKSTNRNTTWREKTSKKNPERDRAYQKTRLVLEWLQETSE